MITQRSLVPWQRFIESSLDFHPNEGVYHIALESFTDKVPLDPEMDPIFEEQWSFACDEAQIPDPHEFITMQSGRH